MTFETHASGSDYNAWITRKTPACVVFVIDQSGSMEDPFQLPGEPMVSKAQGVADVVNRTLGGLVLSCTKGEAVWDRFHIGAVTYGGRAALAPGFSGLMRLSDIADTPLDVPMREVRYPDGTTSEVAFPIWFNPVHAGETPMCAALELACNLVERWAQENPESFPPIIFNISDGDSTDGDPRAAMERLKSISTGDGACLVFNCLLSDGSGPRVIWPSQEDQVPAGTLRSLYLGSSELPPSMRARAAAAHGLALEEGARGVALNAALTDLVRLLDIGTPVPLSMER